MNQAQINKANEILAPHGFLGKYVPAEFDLETDDEFELYTADGKKTVVSIQMSNAGSYTRHPYYIVGEWANGGESLMSHPQKRSFSEALDLAIERLNARKAAGDLIDASEKA